MPLCSKWSGRVWCASLPSRWNEHAGDFARLISSLGCSLAPHWLDDRDQAAGLLGSVQSALGLVESRPAAGSRIFPRLHAPRAMRAANAGIAAVMQRIVGKIVVMNVLPDFSGGPIGERIDLDQMKLSIPLYLGCAGSSRGLVTTDACCPRA